MSIIKSPGQKRKTLVQIITAVFFVLAVLLISSLTRFVSHESLKWTSNADTATATVLSITEETEEYRNLKGRKRYRDHVWLAYEFQAEGKTVSDRIDVSNFFELSGLGEELTVLYQPGNPEEHALEYQVKSKQRNDSLTSYAISTLPFSGGAAYFMYLLLGFVLVRESKKKLPEGFYTESSWLDVDDKYVVAIDQGNLVCFDINKKCLRDVQGAFQSGRSINDLVHLSKHSKITLLPLGEITQISTDHNSDVIYATHDDELHSLEFLNVKVKTHALKRILAAVPQAKIYVKRERTRLEAARFSLISLLILCAGAWFIDHYVMYIIVAMILFVWTLPTLFSRLWDPHVTRSWSVEAVPESTATSSS
ncbi:DUF3592 domain-containing protein [Arenicella xantha]|uniref:Uncharacterized protein DUF3592 n=1 Tax=Arenicella xantha TaxID=644221 RepID=A0A395JQ85_9GAMM|nr:DUF3592 domain-containing protein [Arenicella xantha]RBP51738.1 uncharacterized protein DUF3592 [Arenicella xantha]